jgi:hypothetical protein
MPLRISTAASGSRITAPIIPAFLGGRGEGGSPSHRPIRAMCLAGLEAILARPVSRLRAAAARR